jgi:superfamily II DNA or RNA helicase
MSTKFFTNENGKTLLEKIAGIFAHKNIHFFDVLVGYFRASGYFRIRPFIEKAAKIRILVGIEVDRLVQQAWDKGLEFGINPADTRDQFFEELRRSIQEARYDRDVETGMLGFISDVATGRVELRIHPSQRIHAKLYIFREPTKHDHGYGSVITGSSNLSDAGLANNFEFNVELRDNHDIDFATETFEKLWADGVPVTADFVADLKRCTFLNDTFTPYELYLKFLITYFGNAVHFDPSVLGDLPKGFKKLSYQADAVNDGYTKLQTHGGFFLADVVGLGKTLVATLIAKRFFYANGFPQHLSETLVVVPPAVKPNWEETIDQLGLKGARIVTNGSLHTINDPSRYDLVIVDEAHKFRSDTAEMYHELQRICKAPTRRRDDATGRLHGKKIILISATPLNNRPSDLANLVYLFQDSKDSTLEISNLQHFFAPLIKAFDALKREPNPSAVRFGVARIYTAIREKVLTPLMVRRTRADLEANEAYRADLATQGIAFPKVRPPQPILYRLDAELDALYDRTIRDLSAAEGLTYNRYRAIGFLKPELRARYAQAERISGELARIMKTLLVKRLDSSFFAFRQSLVRFRDATANMVKMFAKGRVLIAPNFPVNAFVADNREDELVEILAAAQEDDPTITICAPDDFEPGFREGLEQDLRILEKLVAAWQKVARRDPKLDEFIARLQEDLLDAKNNPSRRVVVFSESAETTDYLQRELQNAGFERVLVVTAANRAQMRETVRANFDANIPAAEQCDDYDLLIATEVLAEGVNLHRAHAIVNYDTPWNSTRLMQRIGRVNRIGSTAREILIYNFYPTMQVDDDIELQKKAKMKLHAFHVALGEDSQIYSDEEEPTSFGLFDRAIEEEKDERLRLLMELRAFYEQHRDRYLMIKNYPLRARTGRDAAAPAASAKFGPLANTTLTFIRSARRDAFSLLGAEDVVQELTFLQAAALFRAPAEEKPLPLHALHHAQVQAAVQRFDELVQADLGREHKVDPTLGPNERKALTLLSALTSLPFASDADRHLLSEAQTAIRTGRLVALHRDINRHQLKVKKTPVAPAIQLEAIVKLITKHLAGFEAKPAAEPAASPRRLPDGRPALPEIILSESFS